MAKKQDSPLLTAVRQRLKQMGGAALRIGYLFCYIIGLITLGWLKAFCRWILRPLRALGRLLWRGLDWLVLRHARAVAAEAKRFAGGFTIARERVAEAGKRGVIIGVLQTLALPWLAIRRHKKALCRIGNLLMPVAAALVLLLVVQFWSKLSFGLQLEYEGESIGYIADERAFDNAAAMVNARACDTEEGTLQVRTPKLTLAVVSEQDVLDEAAICDKIIEASGDEFVEGTGLYVDGTLVATMTSGEELDDLLAARLAEYEAPGRTVSFVQTVEKQDGLFPVSSVVTAEAMSRLLDRADERPTYYTVAEGDTLVGVAAANGTTVKALKAMNPTMSVKDFAPGLVLQVTTVPRRLQVCTVEVSSYEEEVPFKTVTESDPNADEGTRSVKAKGQKGTRRITEETTAIDGEVRTVKQLSSEVLQEPVTEVIVLGAKRYNTGSIYTHGVNIVDGDGVVTGRMMWPVPAVHSMSQRFHGGHSGIDIANGPVTMLNTPIVAADGGTVKEVNTNPYAGYGLYIVIDHGNGLTTLYAHLNSISVARGQPITRGQEIGRGGSTGNSSGPHLHFEVRVDGRCVDPLGYVS